MARVITFSRKFQKSHPKAGKPTNFVEKILNAFNPKYMNFETLEQWWKLNENNQYNTENLWTNLWDLNVGNQTLLTKHHTIRSGHRFKAGDKFSPRVWSGNPYNSKQIIIAPDIEVKKVFDFRCDYDGEFTVNGKWIDVTSCDIPQNDGLSTEDFLAWFPVGSFFDGQIICWNENIEY